MRRRGPPIPGITIDSSFIIIVVYTYQVREKLSSTLVLLSSTPATPATVATFKRMFVHDNCSSAAN